MVEVARHQVGRGDVHGTLALALERVDARVLQKAPDDRDDADVLRDAGDPWAQAADAAHVQVHAHAGARGAIERTDAVAVDERVHLHRDPPGRGGRVGGDRRVDLGDQPLAQMCWGNQNLAIAQRAPVAGEVVEHVGHIRANVLVDREQAEVGVQPCGSRVVVAGADVYVVAHAIALPAYDKHALGVCLQGRLPVDDMHARLLQCLCPMDVHTLVKACRQLDERDRLLAALRRFDQVGHQWRVVASSIHGLLDCKHVRVGHSLFDEALDRGGKGVIGMVHEHVALAHRSKHVWALALVAQQARVGDWDIGRIAQLRHARKLHDLPQRSHVE